MTQGASAVPPNVRPYDSLLAKGEERRLRILTVARQLLVRNGWRHTSLAQIAKQAGISTAGLLHHFESKEHLLHAVLEARDLDDDRHANMTGDLIEELQRNAERFERSPDLVTMFAVLQMENLQPEDPLHDRLQNRYRFTVDAIADSIRRGQCSGQYHPGVDAAVKAVEITAFLNGMETSWLLDPSIPVSAVFREYVRSLDRQLRPEASI